MHTIAGTAGFLGFEKLGQLGASSELLIASLQEGDFELKPHMIDAIRGAIGKFRTF
jgi:chemotaxis protein histidine kinase CheA